MASCAIVNSVQFYKKIKLFKKNGQKHSFILNASVADLWPVDCKIVLFEERQHHLQDKNNILEA